MVNLLLSYKSAHWKFGGLLMLFMLFIDPVYGQITVSTTDATGCKKNDGKATVTVNTTAAGFDFEYSVDGGGFQASNTFENLAGGSHKAAVRDKNTQCEFSKDFVIKEAGNNLSVSISGTGTTEFCNNTNPPSVTLTASASGGSGNYSYTWPGGSITVSGSGTFSVTVTDNETGCKAGQSGEVIFVPIICSFDPNDIIGPDGYGPGKMIAKSKRHPYMIRFENDPEFATAPAQVVRINHPLDSNASLFSLRLGSFGFAGMTFTVPDDKTFYATRLNLVDSLGFVVDVTAGIDATRKEAFWIFESKDPATGLPPANANLGFLPVNDSSGKGEGFVTYTIRAANHTQTGDSIHAVASIVFDDNGAIETPVIFNTIDAVAPVSQLQSLPAASDSTSVELTWSGRDDTNGSGVRDYSVYVSVNGGLFALYQSGITETKTMFTGAPGNTYGFFTIATDNVGNQEAMKTVAEATIQLVAALQCPASVIVSTDAGACTAILPSLDPRVNGVPNVSAAKYVLSGATTGSGTGTVSGLAFNKGVTIVTYKLLGDTTKQCSFSITVNSRQEICANGLDDDCDGLVDEDCSNLITYYRDADNDRYGNPADSLLASIQPAGYVTDNKDCNDNDNTVYPGAPELCDDKDNNCNGQVDEGVIKTTFYRDNDNDGFGDAANTLSLCTATPPQGYVTDSTDCDDGQILYGDNDGDGFGNNTKVACGGVRNNSDCNDNDASIQLPQTYFRDSDADGFGDAGSSIQTCAATPPAGYVSNSLDCNDALVMYEDGDGDGFGSNVKIPCDGVLNNRDCNDNDRDINPLAREVLDGKDNNCNNLVDEGETGSFWYRDADGDGFGNPAVAIRAVTKPDGYVSNRQDCNDNDATVQTPKTYFRDTDGDGLGEQTSTIMVCSSTPPAGYASKFGDCNDNDATVQTPKTYYRDADGDSFGDATQSIFVCAGSAPAGYVVNRSDCDDANPTANTMKTYYRDRDGDGFGNPQEKINVCAAMPPNGYVLNTADCDDNRVMYRDNDRDGFGSMIMVPCNGVTNREDCDDIRITYADNDGDGLGSAVKVPCGGVTNNADCNDNDAALRYLKTFYRDADGDGYGNAGLKIAVCVLTAPAGYVANSSDCNDSDPSVHYRMTYYRDNDGDGFGNPANLIQVCSSSAPAGYVSNRADCNDSLVLYKDVDRDGFGSQVKVACGGVANNVDCNDADAAVHECILVLNTTKPVEKPAPIKETGKAFELNVFPNPFAKTIHLTYSLAMSAEISIKIYDVMGQELAVLFNGRREKGTYVSTYNMEKFASGVYYCRLSVGGGSSLLMQTVKVVKTN